MLHIDVCILIPLHFVSSFFTICSPACAAFIIHAIINDKLEKKSIDDWRSVSDLSGRANPMQIRK